MWEKPKLVCFTDRQIEALRRDLKIQNNNNLEGTIGLIQGACYYYMFVKNNRDKVSDVRSARENSSAIIHHASSLLKALNTSPLGLYFACFEGHEKLVDKEQAEKFGSSECVLLDNIPLLLEGIISQAKQLKEDDDLLRRMYMLPDVRHKNYMLETLYLWPSLLEIYRDERKQVTYSPDGPLVRYIGTVHEALGIPSPSSSTIRTFVPAWKASERGEAREPC